MSEPLSPIRLAPAAPAGVPAHRDLTSLFDPKSIAVVGASSDESKWGGDIAARLVRNEARRELYFVNRKGGVIQGHPAYESLTALPRVPDLVMLSMPAHAFEPTLEEALALGVKAIVAIFAGLGEAGEEGRMRERRAVELVRAAGAVMIGPNCMGAADTGVGFQGVAYLDIPAGAIGFVSQSGAMGEEFVMRAAAAKVGFSRYVTLGNQADVSVADVIWSYVGHEPTRVIAVYAEDVKDGRELARAACAAHERGKAVVLLAPGRSEAGSRAARSHTGSLAPDSVVLDAACRASGMVRVTDPAAFFDTVLGFHHVAQTGAEPCRRDPWRVGIVTEGGGHGGIAADCATAAGLEVPALGPAAMAVVHEAHAASVGTNPIDFAIGTTDPDAYARVVPAIAQSGEVDAILAVGQLGYWAGRLPSFTEQIAVEVEGARRMAKAARRARLPLLVATVYPDSEPAQALREEGVPVYRDIATAASVMGRLAQSACAPLSGVPDLPPQPAHLLQADASEALDYWSARSALSSIGIPFAEGTLVEADLPDELGRLAASAARGLGLPVAVKAVGLLHKSDLGGVALDLDDAESVVRAATGMAERLGITAVSVERMAPVRDGVELIVGCRRDPRFGPVLMVGSGGLFAEILRDSATGLAPADEGQVASLIATLRVFPLLRGARGRSPLDARSAASIASRLSHFAAAHAEIAAVEVNPLLVLPDGVVALDARVILEGPREGASDE
jgi:acetate---CoA ligase (ADP-forming)